MSYFICLALQNFINVHFRSTKLARILKEKDLSAMLHFVYNEKTVSVLVSHDQEMSEFVLQVPYFPPIEAESDYGEDRCAQIVIDACGALEKDEIDIVQINSW